MEHINLNPSDRELLGRLCDHIDWLRAFCELTGVRVAEDAAKTQRADDTAAEPPWEEPKPTAAEKAASDPDLKPEKVTIDEVRAAAGRLIKMGRKAQAREIVKSYAESVQQIPEDKRAEALHRLIELEG